MVDFKVFQLAPPKLLYNYKKLIEIIGKFSKNSLTIVLNSFMRPEIGKTMAVHLWHVSIL